VPLPQFVAERSAVVWPEVVAELAEGTWIRERLPDVRFGRLEPHILAQARTRLLEAGALIEDSATLNGREVTAYLDGAGLAGRRTRAIRDEAQAKRRLYRTYLGWTANSTLCGHVAERVVVQSLESLAGLSLWLPPEMRAGHIRQLRGRPLPGGPLDAAGFIPFDVNDPGAGMAAFAIEVKNIRGWLYPWSHEVWDLLAKLGTFPDVVPILVARRVHFTTFRMFKDIGALAFDARRQWFARRGDRATITPVTFDRVCNKFGFYDAVLLNEPPAPHPPLAAFFDQKLLEIHEGQDEPLIRRAANRWSEIAPIAGDYDGLRAERMDGDERRELLGEFAARVADAGLMDTGGWARLPEEYYDEGEPEWERE
jgi:hypothetical protein